VDGSSHATTSSIRSAVSIELRLVTDTDRQTQTQDDSIDGGEKRHWEAWTGLRDQTPRPVGHSQVVAAFWLAQWLRPTVHCVGLRASFPLLACCLESETDRYSEKHQLELRSVEC